MLLRKGRLQSVLRSAARRGTDRVHDAVGWCRYKWIEGPRLRRFRNCHAGRRCFLVGNGPSLRAQDLSPMRGELVFVTNRFVLHPQHDLIAPTYFCASDAKFMRDNMTPLVASLLAEKAAKMTCFFPHKLKGILSRRGRFARQRSFYLRWNGKRIWRADAMSLDPTEGIYVGESVILDFCLPLAYYMGCREVYLVGCDTNYGLDRAPDYSQGYFYDVKENPPFLRSDHGTVWYSHVCRSYEIAKRLFEADGRRIYNATAGGKLEVFPRVTLDDVPGHRSA